MLVVAGAAYLNFIESAVATVIVVLATRNVASDAEIDIFHIYSFGRHAALQDNLR